MSKALHDFPGADAPGQLPYRPCVGIMLVNREGRVWAGHRFDPKAAHKGRKIEAEYAWQMPQGGIDPGEDPLAAAFRELHEETSVRSASLIAEAPGWFTYDYPPEVLASSRHGKYRGQAQKWYALRFEGEESEINILTPPKGHSQEFDGWRWEEAAKLPGLIVPFKRQVYQQVVETFTRLVPGL